MVMRKVELLAATAAMGPAAVTAGPGAAVLMGVWCSTNQPWVVDFRGPVTLVDYRGLVRLASHWWAVVVAAAAAAAVAAAVAASVAQACLRRIRLHPRIHRS